MEERNNNQELSSAQTDAASQEQVSGSGSSGSWWDRVPEEDKKKYNRAWLYHLYGDLKIRIYDMEAVLK